MLIIRSDEDIKRAVVQRSTVEECRISQHLFHVWEVILG